MYGLRSAFVFVLMIVTLGASTFMLREVVTGPVIGAKGQRGFAGDYGPAMEAWLDAPGGLAVSNNGDLYIADSNNDVIRRVNARNTIIEPIAGSHDLGTGFSGDNGPAIVAQLDTPDGVAIAPDGDLIVADSHNDRIRRVDRPTRIITTIAGNGENGYDGDEKPATEAALNTPSAVAAAPNGDIYIADTLNYRIRMVDAKTGLDSYRRRRRRARGSAERRRRRAGDQRASQHAERHRARSADRRSLYRRHAPQSRPQGRCEDAHHHHRRRHRHLGPQRR